MVKEIIGAGEFTPVGIANFLEGKIIESENYKGLFTNVYGTGGKSNTFEYDLVVAKKDNELVKLYESSNEPGKPVLNKRNILYSGRQYVTSIQMNLEKTCDMFVDRIESVGKRQEELNSKLYKQFTMGTM
ncbi:hypothetical protein [Staphylococcus phage vB_SsapH-Golestan101-M]|nr:hypothetical protein [Staphylococcus phage vB_SsapH-Golestan101-M]